VTELAHHSTDYSVVEREPPRVMVDNLRIAARLWSSATVFFFFAFLFAYFYLRSLNQNHLWRPKHVDPSLTLGTLTAVAVCLAAVLLLLGLRDHRAERRPAWRLKGALALALLAAAIGFQIAEWSTQGFGPTEGGYASVYIGWTSLEVLFIVGLFYWVETTLATSLRYRKSVPHEFVVGEAAGDPDRANPDIDDPLTLVRAQLEAVSFFAAVLAAIVAVSWLVLYLL
jgi:heme/copper-type cytochrome/quinol oxidase subunit 3